MTLVNVKISTMFINEFTDVIEYVSDILIEYPKTFIMFYSVNKNIKDLSKKHYEKTKEKYYIDLFTIKFTLFEDYSNIIISWSFMEDEDPEYSNITTEYLDNIYKKFNMICDKYSLEYPNLTIEDVEEKKQDLISYLSNINDKNIKSYIIKSLEKILEYYEKEKEIDNYVIQASNTYNGKEIIKILQNLVI